MYQIHSQTSRCAYSAENQDQQESLTASIKIGGMYGYKTTIYHKLAYLILKYQTRSMKNTVKEYALFGSELCKRCQCAKLDMPQTRLHLRFVSW